MPTRRRSFASSGLSYEGVARRLVLPLDAGSERRMTRRGLRAFLKGAATLTDPTINLIPERSALRLYRVNLEADRLGLRLGVRFTRAESGLDRAKVALRLHRERGLYEPKLRRRMREWSNPIAIPSGQTRSRTSRR